MQTGPSGLQLRPSELERPLHTIELNDTGLFPPKISPSTIDFSSFEADVAQAIHLTVV